MGSRWIGVDLDGTLAYYDRNIVLPNIGEPIPAMADRVRKWIDEGKDVRIFTTRASIPAFIPPIRQWSLKHFGVVLAVTCVKEFGMDELWDDRAVRVKLNEGVPCCDYKRPPD
jgi:hypothetical protein